MKNRLLGALFAVIAVNIVNVDQVSAEPAKVKVERTKIAKKYNHLKEKANKGEKLRVIVKLTGTDNPKIRHKSKGERSALLSNNNQKITRLKERFSKHKLKHVREFSRLGYMVVEVDSEQLDELIDSGMVDSVIEDRVITASLDDSVPLIGADIAHASGYGGSGQAVVILDTGFETSHSSFGGRVVEEACFSTNDTIRASLCPNGEETQVGVGASTGCSPESDGCRHGTHVAAIAAGVNGVAPEANIVAVQVFNYAESTGKTQSTSTDIIAALEWVLNDATTENIASVNLSLGGATEYFSHCDTADGAESVIALREAGIATVMASGNDGFSVGIQWPACIGDAIAVGNTNKYDVVRESSNSSELVDMLAPGTDILAAVPGNAYMSLTGTSMASPHVAGAFAVLRSVDSSATITTIEVMLESTGVDVTDIDNNVTKPRIDVNASIAAMEIAKYEPRMLWPNGSVPVASVAQDAHPAINVGDGDTETRWSAQSAGQTITFDLGGTYNLSAVSIAFLKGDSRNTYFDLAISTDGNNFTTVSTGVESSGDTNSLESFELTGTAQYVRIVGQGNSSNNWNSITEVEIFGAAALQSISAPRDLTIDVIGTGEISVSWIDASYSEAGYLVEYALFNEDENVLYPFESKTLPVNSSSTVITGLLDGYYSVRVSAFNGDVSSDYVSESSTPVFYQAPDELSIIGKSYYSYGSAPEAQTLEVSANIDWTLTSDVSWITISPASGSSSASPVVSVTENTSLYYRRGYITLTGGEFTETITITQTGSNSVTAPTGLTIENSGPGEVTVNWNDNNENETGYLVKYARLDGNEGNYFTFESIILDANSTSTVITGLLNDWYEVRVYALKDDEQTGYVAKTISAEYLTSTLVTPEDFTVVVTGEGELTLNWTDLSSGEAGYMLEYARYQAETGDSTYSLVNVSLAEDTTSYVISGLEEYWYYVRIYAFDGGASSDYAIEERKFVQFEENSLTLSTNGLSFAAAGASESVAITANVDWTVTVNAAWLSTDIISGSNDKTVTFTASENTSSEIRSATITVSNGVLTQTISVSQEAAAFSSDPEQLSITSAVASSDDGNTVSNTLDDNLDTRWSVNGDGEYATYDLGAVKYVSAVNIAFYKGDSRNTFVSVEVSDNGTDFTTVLSNISSSGDSLALEEFLIETQARYVRIIGHGNSSNTWNSLTEVEVWGTEI